MAEIISREGDVDTMACTVTLKVDCDCLKICESSGVPFEQLLKSYVDGFSAAQERTVHRRLAKRSIDDDFEIPAGKVKEQVLWAIDNKKF